MRASMFIFPRNCSEQHTVLAYLRTCYGDVSVHNFLPVCLALMLLLTCLTYVHSVVVFFNRLVQQAGGQQSSQQQQQQQQKHASTLLHSRSASSATTVTTATTATTAAAAATGSSALKHTMPDRLSPQQSLRLVFRYYLLVPIICELPTGSLDWQLLYCGVMRRE
jgi:hypothetical protein